MDNKVSFKVDAGIINRLGDELVARQETAVSELIKNSYDAEATRVDVIFENTSEKGGTLIIRDNGLGMTSDQLINGFMRISSDAKIREPFSPNIKRKLAGRKGIGRFAVHKLGQKLTIITQSPDESNAWKLCIDWAEYQHGKDLVSIEHQIERIDKIEQGTILKIESLNDKWSDAEIKRVYRYIMDILQPFPLSDARKKELEEQKKLDSGFYVFCYKRDNDSQELSPIATEQSMIFDYAVAEFEGFVDEIGRGFCAVSNAERLEAEGKQVNKDIINISSSKNRFETVESNTDFIYDEYKPYSSLVNVHFKVFYFIVNTDYIPGNQIQMMRKLLDEQGGVRIYRNGFRVLPYGEKGDDWTKLDESTRRRSILPIHSNLNFFGFVEITDYDEKLFKETSNREKVIEGTIIFDELRDFIYKALIACVIRIANARDIKITTSQKREHKPEEKTKKEIVSIFESLLDTEEGKRMEKSLKDAQDSIVATIQKAADEQKENQQEEQNALLKELEMLRVLSSLGLSIGEFVHEMKQYIPSFESGTYLLMKKTQDEKLKNTAQQLYNNSTLFRSYLAYFDSAISANVTRELTVLDVSKEIFLFEQAIKGDIERSNIQFKIEINGYGLEIAPMHRSEWSSILLNLYSNAKKAIYRKAPVENKILIHIDFSNNYILFDFCDNGDGILEQNKPFIFEPFFTTSSPAGQWGDDNAELIGTGLGLKIVKDIVQTRGGKIYVSSNVPQGMSTCIRIEFKRFNR